MLDPAALPSYRLVAVGAALAALLAPALRFAVEPHDFAVMAVLLGGAATMAMAMRWCRMPRPADALEGGAVILASAMVVGCLSLLLASWAPPLRDAELASADRLLFPMLAWGRMAAALNPHPALVAWMQAIYATLRWQPFALVALLAATGRGMVMWRFLHMWLLALVLCLVVFTLVPAVSAHGHYGVAPGSIPGLTADTGWRPAALLVQVRAGTLRTLDAGSMSGLITFPSFHAMGATLLGWGFARAGAIGRPFVGLNLLMIPTIPLVGSHYFVDVVAGILFAMALIRATRPVAESSSVFPA